MRRPPQDGPRPHRRRTKGEKANKKQMACVGAVYTIEPFVRSADDILDEVLRDERAALAAADAPAVQGGAPQGGAAAGRGAQDRSGAAPTGGGGGREEARRIAQERAEATIRTADDADADAALLRAHARLKATDNL